MYTVFYADENNENLISSDYEAEDVIEKDLAEKVGVLDEYVYLASMYRIFLDCADDFEVFRVERKKDFWKSNKYLLNYVNAMYTFKEYIENKYEKDTPVRRIANKYYRNTKWYTFLCNYRNRIIHQSAVIKDYDKNSGDVYICLDELVDAAEQQMQESSKGKDNAQRFIDFVKAQYADPATDGKHYIGAKKVMAFADEEIRQMSNEIFKSLFDDEIRPCLEWFLSTTLKGKEKYYNTYLVQNETRRNVQINFFIEDYLVNVFYMLGSSFDAVKSWISLLKEKGYDVFYTQGNNALDTVVSAIQQDMETDESRD